MESISLPQSVAAIVGIFIPLIVAFVKTKVQSKQMRFLVALVLSGIIGVIGAVISGADLSWINVIQFTAIAFGMSQIVYNMVKNLFT